MDNQELLQTRPNCTGEVLSAEYQGALSCGGLDKPPAEDKYKSLNCFDGWDSYTLHKDARKKMEEGYHGYLPVPNPHEEVINFALDGICLFGHR